MDRFDTSNTRMRWRIVSRMRGRFFIGPLEYPARLVEICCRRRAAP
jgi:hypothetical protein